MQLEKYELKSRAKILLMRSQYVLDLLEQVADIAKKMVFLVEKVHDAVFSESFRTAWEVLKTSCRWRMLRFWRSLVSGRG